MTHFLTKLSMFWYDARPAWTNGLMRFLGFVLLLDLLRTLPMARDIYTDQGFVKMSSMAELTSERRAWGFVFSIVPEGFEMAWVALAVGAVAFVLLIVNRHTRLACVLGFLSANFLYLRFPYMANGGYNLSRLMLVSLIFLPLNTPLKAPGVNWSVFFGWGVRFIQVQISFIYFSNALCKLSGRTWTEGSAIYYMSRSVEFSRFNFPLLFDQVELLKIASLTLPYIYILVAIGLWFRQTRLASILFVIGFHLMIDLTMAVPVFGSMMMIGALFFVTNEDVQRWKGLAFRIKNRLSVQGSAKTF